MRAGRLKHRIRIENPSAETKAANGEKIPGGWQELGSGSMPAGIETLSTKDYFAAQETHSETTHRVVLRYRDGITSQSRIIWLSRGQERILEPTGPPLNRNNQTLEVLCRERL